MDSVRSSAGARARILVMQPWLIEKKKLNATNIHSGRGQHIACFVSSCRWDDSCFSKRFANSLNSITSLFELRRCCFATRGFSIASTTHHTRRTDRRYRLEGKPREESQPQIDLRCVRTVGDSSPSSTTSTCTCAGGLFLSREFVLWVDFFICCYLCHTCCANNTAKRSTTRTSPTT